MTKRNISPTTYAVADLLIELGWRPDCDAQFTELNNAIFSGRLVTALFSGERHLRDYMDAENAP
jgi:hypothetical protein